MPAVRNWIKRCCKCWLFGLKNNGRRQAVLPSRPDLDAKDFEVMMAGAYSGASLAIKASNQLAPVQLSEKEFADLLDFLNTLTDPSSLDLRKDVMRSLPSGIPHHAAMRDERMPSKPEPVSTSE